MDLFKLIGRIVIENGEAIDSLDKTSKKAKDTAGDVKDLADSGEKSSGKFSSALSKIGGAAVKVGTVVASGIGVAATALGTLTVKALSSAGELEQNMGGSEAVFGKHADKMQAKAKEAFSNMGLSTSDYLATANKMGSLFQGAGFSVEQSMDLSSKAMQRAADVASIMGLDTASAMEAVAGAAKGNFTMMDNLGVAMNETTLANYALSKGMEKSYAEMTQQEKIGVAMEMFLDKTAYAAGNYAKENETLAGSLGTAKAALSNFISGSGTVEDVVSSFSNAADVIVKNINTMFPSLMTGITTLVNQIVPMIPTILEKVLPGLLDGAVGLINGLVSALPSVLNVLTNSALPMVLSGIVTIFNSLISALPSLVGAVASALPNLIPQLIDGLVSMTVTLCTQFSAIIQPIIDNLPSIIVSLVNALLSNLPALISGLIKLTIGIVSALPKILSALWTALTTLCNQATSKLFNKIGEWIRKLFPKSAENIFAVLRTVKSAFETWINNLKAIFSVVVSVLSTPFKLAWNGIKLVWSNVVAYFKMIWNNIKAIFSVVDSVLSGDFKGAWEGIKKIWSNVKQFFSTCVSNIKNAFSNVGEILLAPFRKGKEAIKKIIDNIKGFFTGLKFEFPKIKMPHFSVKPKGWKIGDLLKGEIPSLGIDWYAKAINNPMIMNSPTVFGYNSDTNSVRVGGEVPGKSEVVSGTETLMNMIGNAVESKTNAPLERIAYLLSALLDAIVGGNNDLLKAILAGQKIVLNNRELGRTVREYVG